MNWYIVDKIILNALNEDMYMGDITTENIIDETDVSKAIILAKEDFVLAGIDVAKRVFILLDSDIEFKKSFDDGRLVKKGDIVAELSGCTRSLLMGERTALNFIQRLSGIATKTHIFAEKVKLYKTRIADTRKTTPGLRYLEKYAVKVGGGTNHRINLSDGVLIKDNHIKAAGGIKLAIDKIRRNIPHTLKIEVETENIEQVREAIEAEADIIMLDNMDYELMREAVKIISGKALVEVSGNISLDNLEKVASIGADIISVGCITHSVIAADISMKFL